MASYVTEKEYSKRIDRLEPIPGDVIFTREAPVGQAFCIPEGMKICLGQRVMLLRPKLSKLNAHYLVAHIYSGAVQRSIQLKTAGTTNPHMNVADVRKLRLPAPYVEEQAQIASCPSGIEGRIAEETALLDKLRLQKSGLMDDLLTGRVSVTSLL
jgi:type I restriction enzyme S subunit